MKFSPDIIHDLEVEQRKVEVVIVCASQEQSDAVYDYIKGNLEQFKKIHGDKPKQ